MVPAWGVVATVPALIPTTELSPEAATVDAATTAAGRSDATNAAADDVGAGASTRWWFVAGWKTAVGDAIVGSPEDAPMLRTADATGPTTAASDVIAAAPADRASAGFPPPAPPAIGTVTAGVAADRGPAGLPPPASPTVGTVTAGAPANRGPAALPPTAPPSIGTVTSRAPADRPAVFPPPAPPTIGTVMVGKDDEKPGLYPAAVGAGLYSGAISAGTIEWAPELTDGIVPPSKPVACGCEDVPKWFVGGIAPGRLGKAAGAPGKGVL